MNLAPIKNPLQVRIRVPQNIYMHQYMTPATLPSLLGKDDDQDIPLVLLAYRSLYPLTRHISSHPQHFIRSCKLHHYPSSQ